MAEGILSVRSSKAWEIAHRLARQKNTSVADIVERALEIYDAQFEPASVFYGRLAKRCGCDLDPDWLSHTRSGPHPGLDL